MCARFLGCLISAGLLAAVAGCGDDDGGGGGTQERESRIQILVFSDTAGFRHPSIADAVAFFSGLAAEEGIDVTLGEDPAIFADAALAPFDVLVFANTTGDILDDEQQDAFQRFIRSGGGYVGVHAAADTEHTWPWYGELVGGYFISHPLLPVEVEVTTEDRRHPSTAHLPETFLFTDEIYNFDRNPRHDNSILLTVDEAGFVFPNFPPTPSMGVDHPVAWYKEFEGGRSFYTNLGHRPETWSDAAFQRHLLEGIRWAAAGPHYSRVVLTREARNPMELAVADDGRVFFIERTGEVRLWDPRNGRVIDAAKFAVDTSAENGLLGVALDPRFARTHWIYLYRSTPITASAPFGPPGRNVLARFDVRRDGTIDVDSERVLLEVPSERECCHEGGSLAFAPDGTLFLSVGDNTNPFPAGGYAPLDERPDHVRENSQRTAQNPFDLRGSILRINPDGSIPAGNLFPPDGSAGRPEIYIMGNRNPFRIAVDPDTGRLFWGEVGPDAAVDGARGPRGYDEINYADVPGNYGWPYCIAFNFPYTAYDFASQTVGPPFSCEDWVPALLAYDYLTVDYLALGNALDPEGNPALSELPGLTGRTAIAGTFYRAPAGDALFALPEPYRDRLLMTDWTRDIIASVQVTDSGELGELTRFLPWEEFRRPIDLDVGPDGALYVLEYGTAFNGDNPDAQLSRIEYSASGETSPVAVVAASRRSGTAPLNVHFTSAGSRVAGKSQTIAGYEWDLDGDGRIDSRAAEVDFAYQATGRFFPGLVVRDAAGKRSLPATLEIVVGNSAPQVRILEPRDGITVALDSTVQLVGAATDLEDGDIACEDLAWDVRLGHNAHAHPLFSLSGCTPEFRAFLGGHDEQGTLFFAVELVYEDRGGPGGEPSLTGRDSIRVNVE